MLSCAELCLVVAGTVAATRRRTDVVVVLSCVGVVLCGVALCCTVLRYVELCRVVFSCVELC